jgi:2-polyprenylphenol 6-hydroxylase
LKSFPGSDQGEVTVKTFDVVVAGGGPVGWACALSAIDALPGSKDKPRVALIDREPSRRLTPVLADAPISKRVYTVSRESLASLASLGVIPNPRRSTPVYRIVVYGRDQQQALCIDRRDARADSIASVIEHDELTAQIAQVALKRGVVRIEGECIATDLGADERFVELGDRTLLSTKLLVAADGRGSTLAEALGIDALHRDYEREGVVAHFCLGEPHRGDARQWFVADDSILALLPLPDVKDKSAVSMVWSVTNDRAKALVAMTPDELCTAVSAATGGAVLATEVIESAVSFPLSLTRTINPIAERAIVTGDAAHAIHPLAGQGVNLGFADARALQAALSHAARVHGDAGHALLLSRYRRERYGPTLAMQMATDGLARLYNLGEMPRLSAVSDVGMRVLGHVPAFRRMVSSAAA